MIVFLLGPIVFAIGAVLFVVAQYFWLPTGQHHLAAGRPMVWDLLPKPSPVFLGTVLETVKFYGIATDGETPQVMSATVEIIPPEDVTALSYLVRPVGIPDTGPVLHST